MRFITSLFLSLISGFVMAQTNNTYAHEDMLMGVWRFQEMRNQNNEKITHYGRNGMKILATGPTITFMPDMSYKKSFFAGTYDSGFWKYDSASMQIRYRLYIDSTTFAGKDLIKRGLAVKHSDGKYYENIVDYVFQISRDELVLLLGADRQYFRRVE